MVRSPGDRFFGATAFRGDRFGVYWFFVGALLDSTDIFTLISNCSFNLTRMRDFELVFDICESTPPPVSSEAHLVSSHASCQRSDKMADHTHRQISSGDKHLLAGRVMQ